MLYFFKKMYRENKILMIMERVYIFTFLVDHEMFNNQLGGNVSLRMGDIRIEEKEIEQGF